MLESVKVDTIAKAISHRDFQLAAIHKLFEYQKYAAECVAENGKKELMEVMLAEVNDRIKATADRLAGTHHEATKGALHTHSHAHAAVYISCVLHHCNRSVMRKSLTRTLKQWCHRFSSFLLCSREPRAQAVVAQDAVGSCSRG